MKLKLIIFITFILISALSLSGCSFLSKKYEKKETVTYKVNTTGKTKVVLENLNGDIRVIKGDTTPVLTVQAVKIDKVRKKDLDKPLDHIEILIDSAGNSLRISTEYHKEKSFISFSTFSRHVDFDLIVPPNMEVSVENTNGDINVNGVETVLEARTTNGNIKAMQNSGKCIYDITNGSFEGELDSTKGITLDITNGKCRLELAKTFLGAVDAEVTNGKVSSENLQFSNVQSERKSFKGYIGNPEPIVKIEIVNGSVKLLGK